jgi:hypothetical protein
MPVHRERSVNVGVDVGKHQLDAFIHERGLAITVPNIPDGVRQPLARSSRYRIPLSHSMTRHGSHRSTRV